MVHTSEEAPPVQQKIVYFRKTEHVELDPAKVNDGMLIFGFINSPLRSLDSTVRYLYARLLKEQNKGEWGKASIEHRNDFVVGTEALLSNLLEARKTLSGGLTLTPPGQGLDGAPASMIIGSPDLIRQVTDVFEDWCIKIESYLDDSDRFVQPSHRLL